MAAASHGVAIPVYAACGDAGCGSLSVHQPKPERSALAAGLVVFIASFAVAPSASAAEPIPQVVVTANRVPEPASKVIADLVVIDPEQIARAGPIGLAELLQRHAGVELSSNGGPGQPSGVFVRGANTNQVVVLVDGVRINSATTGTTALEHIPLMQIDHIEVLRGPASSLYGSDAIGGVIQIFTRAPDGANASVAGGSDHRGEIRGGFGGSSGDWSWSLNAGALYVRAFSATNPSNTFFYNPDDDPYRNQNANGAVQWRWADGHRVSLRGTYFNANTHFDSGPNTDPVNHQQLGSLALESQDRITEIWLSTLRLARGTDHSNSTGGDFPSTFDTNQAQVTWQNDLTLGSTTNLSVGADWRRGRVTSTTAYTQTSSTIASVFAAAQQTFGTVQLEESLRTDRNSQFGTHTTGRIGAGWSFAQDWRVTAAVGTAFRAPTFNDLYFPSEFGFSGNPNLLPEQSRGGDASLRYRSGGTTVSLTAFDNQIDDLIAVDPTFSTVINVNRARIHGTTLAATQVWGAWQGDAEWTHQSPRDADTGNLLVRRAIDYGRAGLSFNTGTWQVGGSVIASSARFDSAANTPQSRMGGYGLVSLYANWSVLREVTLGARVLNATDKRYEIAQGYNTAPRQYMLTLDATWK
jgi:vitamin B12 transporter